MHAAKVTTVTLPCCRNIYDQDVLSVLRRASNKASEDVNNRPLIGLLSQVLDRVSRHCTDQYCRIPERLCCVQPGEPAPKGMSYIAASYVKFIEVPRLLRLAKLNPDHPLKYVFGPDALKRMAI